MKITVLISPGNMPSAPRYVAALKGSLTMFDKWYGPYPYDRITLIDPPHGGSDAGGMEYPTLITGDTSWNMPKQILLPEIVTEHEFGHQYWYGMVATNEFEEAWLDEGINSYTEVKVMDALYGKNSFMNFPFAQLSEDQAERTMYLSAADTDPIARLGWKFYSNNSYGGVTYGKTATMLLTLEKVIGEDTMREALHTYFMRYRFTHPTGEDFIKTVEEVSGKDLHWYFSQADYGTQVMDYEVANAHSDPLKWWEATAFSSKSKDQVYRTYVTIRRTGDFLFPVDVLVKFDDGSTATEHWDGQDSMDALPVRPPGKSGFRGDRSSESSDDGPKFFQQQLHSGRGPARDAQNAEHFCVRERVGFAAAGVAHLAGRQNGRAETVIRRSESNGGIEAEDIPGRREADVEVAAPGVVGVCDLRDSFVFRGERQRGPAGRRNQPQPCVEAPAERIRSVGAGGTFHGAGCAASDVQQRQHVFRAGLHDFYAVHDGGNYRHLRSRRASRDEQFLRSVRLPFLAIFPADAVLRGRVDTNRDSRRARRGDVQQHRREIDLPFPAVHVIEAWAVVILFLLMVVRLWFDMAQVIAVFEDEKRMHKALRLAAVLVAKNFFSLFWLYFRISFIGWALFALGLHVWMMMLPPTSTVVAFLLSQLMILFWIGTRLWQRASETLWYRDYRSSAEAMQPVWNPTPAPVIEPIAVPVEPAMS